MALLVRRLKLIRDFPDRLMPRTAPGRFNEHTTFSFTGKHLRRSAEGHTSVSRQTGTLPESMMSRRTQPGPTDGSWSTSPTRITAALYGIARTNCQASEMSNMLVSSMMNTSPSSGWSALCLN